LLNIDSTISLIVDGVSYLINADIRSSFKKFLG